MTFKYFLYAILFLTITTVLVYTLRNTGQSQKAYTEKVREERRKKDIFMRSSSDSPFKGKAREQFDSLRYFTPDLTYRIKAKVEPINVKEYLVLPTSDGKEKKYIKYAYADFELNGQMHRLLMLKGTDPKNKDNLFIPFADATSGDSTYGAGRYLDVEQRNKNTVILDFNKAYNPYCNYSDEYSCPFPPRENILETAIRAGEKTYEK